MRIGLSTMLGAAIGLVCMNSALAKPGADEALTMLKDGNERFSTGKATHPRSDKARQELTAKSNQGDYAIATIVSCSDSRVPPEFLFDTGLMDLFVVRIAGNVCDTDEIGSAEYGVRHVNTPLLVVLGHSQCGAVTAVAKSALGEGHALEKNIPPLVDNIIPAVERVRKAFPQATSENLITRSIDENVWQSITDILTRSAAIRDAVREGKVKIVGAIYDLESGRVRWLSSERVEQTVKDAEANPNREKEAMAGGGHSESHAGASPTAVASHGEAHGAATPAPAEAKTEKTPEPAHGH